MTPHLGDQAAKPEPKLTTPPRIPARSGRGLTSAGSYLARHTAPREGEVCAAERAPAVTAGLRSARCCSNHNLAGVGTISWPGATGFPRGNSGPTGFRCSPRNDHLAEGAEQEAHCGRECADAGLDGSPMPPVRVCEAVASRRLPAGINVPHPFLPNLELWTTDLPQPANRVNPSTGARTFVEAVKGDSCQSLQPSGLDAVRPPPLG